MEQKNVQVYRQLKMCFFKDDVKTAPKKPNVAMLVLIIIFLADTRERGILVVVAAGAAAKPDVKIQSF